MVYKGQEMYLLRMLMWGVIAPAMFFGLVIEDQAAQVNMEESQNQIQGESEQSKAVDLSMPSEANIEINPVQVIGERFNNIRNSLSPETGGSVYHFDTSDIQNLPSGENTALNDVLLQAPGVVNDSYGQLHIRGDHANTQYRINGIILPEGISGFGQALDTRFAQSINLLTGALPAQYGYRTAGVIEITTKGNFNEGGNINLYGGSNNTFNPSIEYGKTDGNLSYFIDGSYLTNNIGIENPTSSSNPMHDITNQKKGFAYLSYILNDSTSLSFIASTYTGRFQIPNNPGQTPDPNGLGILNRLGLTGYSSSTLKDQQLETNSFAITALQGSLTDKLDYQIALFTRYSSFHYTPDIIGNLVFNGVASDIFRSSFSNGIQADTSYHLNESHTIRFGLFGNEENIRSNDTSTVFSVNSNGLVSGAPFAIVDNHPKNGNTLIGMYIQDEWKTTNNLTVNYGLRFDAVDAFVSEQQISPRIGLVFKATDLTTLHAGYSRYFTPPPTELVSSSTQAVFQNTTNAAPGQNSPVKSERGDYLDAGFTHQLSSAISLGVDSYYKQTQNTIDEGQFGPALLLTPFNYAEGKIYGIEFTANYKSENFSGYANVARNVSKAKDIISGQYLFDQATLNYAANNWVNVDHAQALTMSAGSSYSLPSGVHLNGDLIFESGLRNGFANTTSLPCYTVVNLGASQKINLSGFGSIEAKFVINNLFDKVYEIRDGSGIGVFAPQYGPRRGVFLGMSKSF